MKAIYSCCIADPFIQVAQVLKDKHNYDPIFWIGYEYDDSRNLVSRLFPNAFYQEYWDAWRGIFPKGIEKIAKTHPIDIDFIKNNAQYELQALKSMDRMDPDRHSFSFQERQRFYKKLVRYWDAFILEYKPDIYISAVIPHRVFDYVLYLVCKYRGVKTIIYFPNSITGRIMPMHDIFQNEERMKLLYIENKKSENDIKISPDIYKHYEKAMQTYDKGRPDYMVDHAKTKKDNSNLLKIIRNFLFFSIKNYKDYLGKYGYFYRGFHPYWVEKNKPIENAQYKFFKYSRYRLRTLYEKKSMEKLYKNIIVKPDYGKPYIYFGLHYQPEATTSPGGDLFVDQMLAVNLLASNIPDDWVIYVKENPLQFNHTSEGQTYRQKTFYTDALENPKIKFISLDANSFQLTNNSKAVATISGTLGWEAMIRKKPVIIFAQSWYEYYDGVYRVLNNNCAKNIVQFINNFNFDQHNLESYIKAFDDFSVRAYHYKGVKEKVDIGEEECVNNLVESIITYAG